MSPRRIFLGSALILVVAITFYVGGEFHLQNYFAGFRELEMLSKTDIRAQHHPPSFCYVAHAGGGLNKRSYLNTLEALENSYKNGFRYVEVDIHYTADSVPVLAHDFVAQSAANFLADTSSGTHLSLREAMQWIKDKDLIIITDIKVNNVQILTMIHEEFPHQNNQLIPQAYFINEIPLIYKLGFKNIIFTNYIAAYPNGVLKALAGEECLFAITIPYDVNLKVMQMTHSFEGLTTPFFTHSINDPELVDQLRDSGIRGVYTDFLLDQD